MHEVHKMPTAHSLEEAANSDNSMEGYAAINYDPHDDIAKLAYALYEERGGSHGSHEEDWHRAEQEIRRRRPERQKSESSESAVGV